MRNSNYMTIPTTLGQLKASGYRYRTVKEELRANLVERLRSKQPVFPAIVGYADSVVPALERAVLAGHDVIMLGERGQAKSRLMRALVGLLDDSIPVVEGSELNDHPYQPVSAMARNKVAELGDETPIVWVGRDLRYSEKLATPDTAVADLIGDVDPIRVAEGRYLGDELTIHYGLVPRTNRGIVAINELPANSGLPTEHPRGARHPGTRLQDSLATGRHDDRERKSRGLHAPRSHHHSPKGSLRHAGPDPLPRTDRR